MRLEFVTGDVLQTIAGAQVSEFSGTLDAHSRYFARLLDQQGKWLEGDAEFTGQRQLNAFNSLNLELEDLMQAFQYATAAPLVDVLPSFLHNFRLVLDNSGELHRACECAETLTLVTAGCPPELRSAALIDLAMALNRMDEYGAALPRAREALEAAELTGEVKPLARAKYALALVYLGLNRHEQGNKLLHEARQVFETFEDGYMLAFIQLQLGCASMAAGEYELAHELLQSAADEFGRLGSLKEQSAALTNLIQALIRLGRIEEALSQLSAALAAKDRLGDTRGLAICNLYLAACHSERDEPATAKAAALVALEAFTRLGLLNGQATVLANLGMIELAQDELTSAEECLDKALLINGKLGNARGEAAALRFKTMVALARSDCAAAVTYLCEAWQLATENSLERDLVICAGLAGCVAVHQKKPESGLQLIGAAMRENETRHLGFESDLRKVLEQHMGALIRPGTDRVQPEANWRLVLQNFIESQKHC